jgi:hypothetical protein
VSQEFSEEELRALEAEMERISVDDVLIQTTVTLLNLGARKAGLATWQSETEPPQPDWEQVRQAIDGARALVPLLEPRHAAQLGPIRDTLSRLQMVYAQQAGGAPAGPGPQEPAPPAAGEQQPGPAEGPGPAQRSGQLWIPGQ